MIIKGLRQHDERQKKKIFEQNKMMNSQKVVTPVKTGVQMVYNSLKKLDSGFRRNDGLRLIAPTARRENGIS
jgi:hypothetical protein